MRRVLVAAAKLLAPVAALVTLCVGPASAAEFLQNGGFEDGLNGWASSHNVTVDGTCPGRTGSGAAALVVDTLTMATVTQTIPISGAGGPYVLTGYVRLLSGEARAQIHLQWVDTAGATLDSVETAPILTSAYAPIELNTLGIPKDTAGLQVVIRATTASSGVVCIDDLALQGPLPSTFTPTPPPPTATSTVTSAPPDSPTPASTTTGVSQTPSPSATSVATQTTTPAPSQTATRTATPSPAFTLQNAGFEEGLAPWQKFGGELGRVGSPVAEGNAAASLTSTTSSTKWAYQVVKVVGGSTYEFAGHLLPGAGVEEAYLRVSWYASEDGSGSAISDHDSPVRLAGPAGSYTPLSTGPATAPPDAASARLRVMLAPVGSGEAVLYMDQFTFAPAEAATATPTPTPTAPASATPTRAPQAAGSPTPHSAAARAATAPTAAASGASSPPSATPPRSAPDSTRTPVAEVMALSSTADLTPEEDEEPFIVWALGGLALFSVLMVGALQYARRTEGR